MGDRLSAVTCMTAECQGSGNTWNGAEEMFELDLEESADASGERMKEHSRAKAPCLPVVAKCAVPQITGS